MIKSESFFLLRPTQAAFPRSLSAQYNFDQHSGSLVPQKRFVLSLPSVGSIQVCGVPSDPVYVTDYGCLGEVGLEEAEREVSGNGQKSIISIL